MAIINKKCGYSRQCNAKTFFNKIYGCVTVCSVCGYMHKNA